MKQICLSLIGLSFLIVGCTHQSNHTKQLNEKASLPASFKFNQLGLRVITSWINKKPGTMSTLYGNDLALKNAMREMHRIDSGEMLALITWKQQDDDHWFGARIPGELLSVETLSTTSNGVNQDSVIYKLYKGDELELSRDTLHQSQKIRLILGQRPSVMP